MTWRSGTLLLGATLALACKPNCFDGTIPASCDGDVWVHCPGGWMTFAWHPVRTNCRDEGKRCVGPFIDNPWVGCMAPVGPCDPKTFVPRCEAYNEHSKQGRMLVCVRGETLPAGDSCTAP